MSGAEGGGLAVFDLGKTNSKMLVFGADGRQTHEDRTAPRWRQDGAFRVLDHAALDAWMREAIAVAVERHGVGGVMVSGHGCTYALVRGRDLLHPVLDYEQEPPADIAARIEPLLPSFAETFTPRLPQGLNVARHMLWLEEVRPDLFAEAEAILSYPQFWSWRLGGRLASEVSYLGCHSHLWAPLAGDYSSLVEARGWRRLMPPLERAGAVLGHLSVDLPGGGARDVAIHNGVHDSNASLYVYRAVGHRGFTMVSTGTWVIVMNPDCPLDQLDPARDTLANVTVDGQPVATARFMGGREFDLISDGHKGPVSREALEAVVAKEIMALPSFASGGPYPGREGRLVGSASSAEERAAAALLYAVLMTDVLLDLTRSAGPVILDGGLTRLPAYPGLLAALRPGQPVLVGINANGSASGAAALAFEASGRMPFKDDAQVVEPMPLSGLEAYRRHWRERADAV
jgi:sugar (pentulose or hexulose) kinase